MIRLCIALLAMIFALPAWAEPYMPVRDKQTFMSLIDGKELRLPLWQITLQLQPDGEIAGSALGWGIKGRWEWQDGYFCREMDWSGTPIPFNCQLVEVKGAESVRFTVDRGAGDSAAFRLR
jgi:hypothetical protein